MNKQLIDFSVDEALTPDNARERGYKWVNDFIYDTSGQMEMSLYEDVKALVEDGFKIGKAKEPIGNSEKGLYRPLKTDKII